MSCTAIGILCILMNCCRTSHTWYIYAIVVHFLVVAHGFLGKSGSNFMETISVAAGPPTKLRYCCNLAIVPHTRY